MLCSTAAAIGRRLCSTAAAPPCKSTSMPLLNIVLHEPQIPPNTGTAARSKACSQQPLRPPTRLIRAAYSAYSTAFGRPGTIGRLALATRCRLHLVGRLGFSLDEKGFRREARPQSSRPAWAHPFARAHRPALFVTARALHVHCTWTQARGPRLLAASRLCAPRDVGGLPGGGSAAWSNLLLPGSGSCRAGRLGLGAPSWRRWPVRTPTQSLGRWGPALQPWSLSEAPTKDADPAAF